jgi:DNA-directed RNA polymerase subunit H (RpoH/RPB5)
MKKTLLSIIILMLLSCESKEIMTIDQVSSDEKVRLYRDVRDLNNDSINISIPLEYKLTKGQKEIYSFGVIFVSNKKDLEELKDFRIFNKSNKKLLYSTVELSSDEIPNHLLITENDIRISKEKAEELLIKYKIHENISKIKELDTINLISYNEFKKDNPSIIKELNKINDSIVFRLRDGKTRKASLVVKKINW